MAGRNNGTLVCVPTVAKTVEEMLRDVDRAKASGADAVEIRLDHLAAFSPRRDLELLLRARPLPFIVTYRCALASASPLIILDLPFPESRELSRLFGGRFMRAPNSFI